MKTAILISTDKLRAALVIPVRSTYRKRKVSHLPPSITAGYSDRCLCFHSKAKTTQPEQFTDHTAYRVFTLNMSRCPYYPIQTYLTSISKTFLREHTVCSESILITLKVIHLHLNHPPRLSCKHACLLRLEGTTPESNYPIRQVSFARRGLQRAATGTATARRSLSHIRIGTVWHFVSGAGRWYGKVVWESWRGMMPSLP